MLERHLRPEVRLMLERHLRPRFKATRLEDHRVCGMLTDDPYPIYETEVDGTIERTKWFNSAADAYRWIARGYLFRMRAADLCSAGLSEWFDRDNWKDCKLCDRADGSHIGNVRGVSDTVTVCRWHDHEWFGKVTKRIARLLRHWDKTAGPFTRKRLEDALARAAERRAA
jgi:hypothetical protein